MNRIHLAVGAFFTALALAATVLAVVVGPVTLLYYVLHYCYAFFGRWISAAALV